MSGVWPRKKRSRRKGGSLREGVERVGPFFLDLLQEHLWNNRNDRLHKTVTSRVHELAKLTPKPGR